MVTLDLEAIRARLGSAEEHFLDAVERDLASNPPRTITEAVTIARFYPSIFEDVRALLAEVESARKDVRAILLALGDDWRYYGPDPSVWTKVAIDRATGLKAEVARLNSFADACTADVVALKAEVERLESRCCLTADTESSYEGTDCKRHGVGVDH